MTLSVFESALRCHFLNRRQALLCADCVYIDSGGTALSLRDKPAGCFDAFKCFEKAHCCYAQVEKIGLQREGGKEEKRKRKRKKKRKEKKRRTKKTHKKANSDSHIPPSCSGVFYPAILSLKYLIQMLLKTFQRPGKKPRSWEEYGSPSLHFHITIIFFAGHSDILRGLPLTQSTHKVSKSTRGGFTFYYKTFRGQVHGARSSCTADARPRNGFENGPNLAESRIEYVLLTT